MTTLHMPSISTGPTAVPMVRDIDPRATARGVRIETRATTQPLVWVVTKIHWLDEQESQGRHHIYADVLDEQGKRLVNIPLEVRWPTGDHIILTEAKPGEMAAANFPMSPSRNEFSITVAGATLSETVTGIGMGAHTPGGYNAGIHTSTFVVFQRVGMAQPLPMPPSAQPPASMPTRLIRPCAGTITQRWGQNPQDYARFNIPGHNGVDIANASGTPIRAIADGVVAYMDTDPDYGNYIRLDHPQLGFQSFYAHLLGQRVRGGDTVKQGQEIGMMGSTGNSTGPHLHFEIRLTNGNAYVDLTGGFGKGRIDPAIVYWLYNREVF